MWSEISNNNGVSQSSTLRPLLFLLYSIDIVHTLDKCKIHLVAVATLLDYCSNNLNDLIDTINSQLQKISSWSFRNVLKLNDNKAILSNITGYDELQNRRLAIQIEYRDNETLILPYFSFVPV